MKKIAVLGAGMIGSAIAVDLSSDYDVTAIDNDQFKLNKVKTKAKLSTLALNIADKKKLSEEIFKYDLAVIAIPGFLGYSTLQTIIEAGKNVVDISFFEEDPFNLDKAAKEKNVTAIIDCGVAPGMMNIILGYYNSLMEVNSFECLIGGLPFKRSLPFQYKAPFSPSDVIEIYTRHARLVEAGKIISKPALSDPEYVEIDPIGTLEAFNTDGLRTLLSTMKVPNMKEKTLRYPGHIQYMKMLRDFGFFSEGFVEIDGKKIRPVDLASKLLFPIWKLEDNEPEFTAMRITIKCKVNNQEKEFIYNLFDKNDEITGFSSMARTTGFTCTAAVRLLLEGKFNRKGICPPEFLGEDEECFEFIINELKKRNVVYNLEMK